MRSRVTGQVTIPKHLREEFGLTEGDEVVWEHTDDGIVIRKANRASARDMLVPDDTPPGKREEVAKELGRVDEHREEIEHDLRDDEA